MLEHPRQRSSSGGRGELRRSSGTLRTRLATGVPESKSLLRCNGCIGRGPDLRGGNGRTVVTGGGRRREWRERRYAAKRCSERALAFAASTSRFFGGAVVTRWSSSFRVAASTASTASANASTLARE